MTTINNLSLADALQTGDSFVIYDVSQGDARRISLTTLFAYLQNNLAFATEVPSFLTQYASPSSTAFNITIVAGTEGDENVHLILTPTAGFADGTITLPAGPIDKQEVLVNCTQQVTTLVVAGNGATVTGEPSSLGADDFFRMKYDLPSKVWYRVG